MKPFDYIRTSTLDEVTALLSRLGTDGHLLAGGTDLLLEWRRSAARIRKTVVDISFLHELKGISSNDGQIVLKPLVTHSELMKSSVIRASASFLSSAASTIGSPQIRNRGTVGGNIMNAAACADTVPPLIALDAVVTLQSAEGMRQMRLADLFLRPYQTTARDDEILTGISFRQVPPRARSTFIKLGRRNAVSISRLSVAACVMRDESGVITDARIVPGATFPTWHRVAEAERMLIGEKGGAKLFEEAGRKVSGLMIAETGRRWSTEYKEPVIAVLVRRALEECCL